MTGGTVGGEHRQGDDDVVLWLAAAAALTVVVGSWALFWDRSVRWLVEHDLLLAARENPEYVLPGAGGAGLDGPRLGCVIVVAVVLPFLLGDLSRRASR